MTATAKIENLQISLSEWRAEPYKRQRKSTLMTNVTTLYLASRDNPAGFFHVQIYIFLDS